MSFGTLMKTTFNVSKAFVIKNAPTILTGVGIAAGAGSVVTACIATKKIDKVLDPAKAKIEEIKTDPELDDKAYKKELMRTYAKTGGELAKLYSVSAGLGALSVISILGSHHISMKRTAALSATVVALDTSFQEYRKRVSKELGKETDQHFMTGSEVKKIEVEEVQEDGTVKKVKKTVPTIEDGAKQLGVTVIFDQSNPNWSKFPDTTAFNLGTLQNILTAELTGNGKGYEIYLYKVLDQLGIDYSDDPELYVIAHSVGWKYDPDDPTKNNYISFGITSEEAYNHIYRANLNGYDPAIVLEFNYDTRLLADQFSKLK